MKSKIDRFSIGVCAALLLVTLIAATYKSLTIDAAGWVTNAETANFARLKVSTLLYAQAIAEYTADAGIDVDGVTMKDGSVSATGDVTATAFHGNLVKTNQLYIDGGAFVPCTTLGAESDTTEVNDTKLEFDIFAFAGGATEERVQTKFAMPSNYLGGTVTFKVHWMGATGASAGETCEWGVKATSIGNAEAITMAWGTAGTVSDAVCATDTVNVTAATGALTIGNTPAGGDLVFVEIYRNTDGTDDMNEDAWLLGAEMTYQEN